MADLTPEEQRFFETGEIQPGMAQNAPSPIPDPIANAGIGTGSPPAPAPAAPAAPVPDVVALVPQPPQPPPDVAEVLRRSLAEAQQRVAALEQHIVQTQQPLAPKEPEAPDPATDPLGAMMHQIDTANKRILELQAQVQGQNQQQAQLQQFQQFKSHVESLRDQFIKTAPDFHDAYNHIRNVRMADLRNFGLAEPQIQATLLQDEVALAENAIRTGRNPAEVIYSMAKQHGYNPAAHPAGAPPSPAAKVEQIQQAQAAARQLPTHPTPPGEITLEALKAASDSDLNAMVLDPKAWDKIANKDSYPL